MATKNDITGDSIQTKATSDAYRDNYDRIFGKKKEPISIIEDTKPYVLPTKCDKCGISLEQPIGYVCSKSGCPVFVQSIC